MTLPKKVKMVEVGPRDGLQNEAQNVPAAVKVELIDRLTDAGLPVIEATAFVSPKWVPQMADNAEVMAGIRRKKGVDYPVLVPNRKGLDAAIAAGCDEVVVFAAATEAFSKRNTNCTIDEGLARFSEVCAEAIAKGLRVRGDISAEGTAWAVSVNQTFEWPGRILLRKAIADRSVQLAEAGLEQFRAALRAEVLRRGYALFAAQRRAAAAAGETRQRRAACRAPLRP